MEKINRILPPSKRTQSAEFIAAQALRPASMQARDSAAPAKSMEPLSPQKPSFRQDLDDKVFENIQAGKGAFDVVDRFKFDPLIRSTAEDDASSPIQEAVVEESPKLKTDRAFFSDQSKNLARETATAKNEALEKMEARLASANLDQPVSKLAEKELLQSRRNAASNGTEKTGYKNMQEAQRAQMVGKISQGFFGQQAKKPTSVAEPTRSEKITRDLEQNNQIA